jgi:hypothetical protein
LLLHKHVLFFFFGFAGRLLGASRSAQQKNSLRKKKMPRKCWVGGNFKSAATLATVQAQVKVLNEAGAFPSNVEVVIAPSALHIGTVAAGLRPEVGVAIQNIHTAKVR